LEYEQIAIFDKNFVFFSKAIQDRTIVTAERQ